MRWNDNIKIEIIIGGCEVDGTSSGSRPLMGFGITTRDG
jgi:hypothetical protein